MDVFYVVQSTGALGERAHCLRSDLYETRPQAETALARLRDANPEGSYGVWKSTTYIEPAGSTVALHPLKTVRSRGSGSASRLECSFGTPLHLIRRDVFHVRRNRPHMTERIFEGAGTIAIELVLNNSL
jgi:hypothetical protein